MATNDIQPFAQGPNPNVLSQAAFLTAAARSTGFQSGVADSATANKVFRQSNWIAYLLAQWIVDQSGQNMLDDGNYPNAKAALIAAIQAQITAALTAGNFATVPALANEAQQRAAAVGSEASTRSTADSNEAATRASADAAIYAWTQQNFVQRSSTAGGARQNFQPGDGQQINSNLAFISGTNGGLLLVVASINHAAVQPGACWNQIYVNGQNLNADLTNQSQTAVAVIGIAPNAYNTIQQVFITTSSGGQGWSYVGMNCAFIFVAN